MATRWGIEYGLVWISKFVGSHQIRSESNGSSWVKFYVDLIFQKNRVELSWVLLESNLINSLKWVGFITSKMIQLAHIMSDQDGFV